MEKQWLWIGGACAVFCISGIFAKLLIIKEQSISYFFYIIIVWSLIVLGGIEATIGFLQLFEIIPSRHSLYAFTGTLYNPGPYCGYLAMIFPMALNEYLRLHTLKVKRIVETIGCYLSLSVCLAQVCLLFAGSSRAALLAASISGIWTYCNFYNKKILDFVHLFHKNRFFKVSGIVLCALLICIAAFMLKKQSALGRLFMWKISVLAISESPFAGHGYNSFTHAYGEAQEKYFSGNDYLEWEELVAGSPDSAFNEYLQIAVEYGVVALVFMIVCICFCLYRGYRKKRISACGGVISLLIFAMFSYPMHIPAFIITFIFLLVACAVDDSWKEWGGLALLSGILSFYTLKNNNYDECCEWYDCRARYQLGAYEAAKEGYEKLYPVLDKKALFLYEYGHCLHKLKEYDASNEILKKAMVYSSDPMILNIIGENYQHKQHYDKAEEYFMRSVHRLPGRIYPYYLLFQLYAQADYFHADKMKQMANIVLTKQPKVYSGAIDEMRREVKSTLEKHINYLSN
ncbi:O-antigen ligase family protein [Bacteroides sp. UBA939]|uniref:O-antigen ligase family protein n=1 Tax=Bacteroides sp. UBA939 TaxID=1946092 RepID=UPI0025B8F764|nr:O-antigen ligase family protein [Bacteroides sp. UBA939]